MSTNALSEHLPTEVMSGADSAWLRMEQPENQMAITGIMYLNPKPDLDRFRRLLYKRLLRYDRFRQIATGRKSIPLWEPDTAFDMNYHLREVQLGRDTNATSVQEYVGQVMSTPLDFSRPLWQMQLLEEKEGTESAVLILKLHHCIADGIGLVRILLSLARVERDGAYFEPHKEYQPKRRGTGGISTGPLHVIADSAAKILRGLYKFVSMPADTSTHLKGTLQVEKKAAWSPLLPLDVVKGLAARYRATINDILLWFVCNALRDYMIETGELNTQNSSEALKSFNVRVSVPVNLRANDDFIATGNRFGLIFIRLPLGTDDSVERLRHIQQEMRQVKASGEAMVSLGVLRLIGRAPLMLERGVIDFLSRKCSAVVTNVPGPRRPLYMAGSKMENLMFWVPTSGMLGLGISLLSYNGSIQAGVAADSVRVSRPERITQLFYEAFQAAAAELREENFRK